MQKFEESFEGTYHSSAKKNNNKKTKILINVSGTSKINLRDPIRCS